MVEKIRGRGGEGRQQQVETGGAEGENCLPTSPLIDVVVSVDVTTHTENIKN